MITLNKIVYDILEIAYGGQQPDDKTVSDKQVAFWINEVRSLLLIQEISRRNSINDEFIQSLECVEFAPVEQGDSCIKDCSLIKSVYPLPATINRSGRNTILSVESTDGNRTYSETKGFRKKTNINNRYTSKQRRWYIENGYMYLTNSIVVEQAKITGVFDFPEDVASFSQCDKRGKFSWDDRYPITADMANNIVDIIIKTKLGIIRSIPKDETNDGRETNKQVQAKNS